jgi:hypothetical protein
MAMMMKVVGDKEGSGNGGKSDVEGNKGGGRAMAMAMKRVMVMETRVAGKRWQRQ